MRSEERWRPSGEPGGLFLGIVGLKSRKGPIAVGPALEFGLTLRSCHRSAPACNCRWMDQETSYAKRLRRAATGEFKAFWTAYRNWVTIASFFVSPTLIQIIRHGWRSMVNLDETVTNGALGLIVSLGGTYLIAIFRGAKSIDATQRNEILEANRLLSKKGTRTPWEERCYRKAESEWRELSETAKEVVRCLWTHERLQGPELNRYTIPGVTYHEVVAALEGELAHVSFMQMHEQPGYGVWWEPVPAYRDVVKDLLSDVL